MKAALHQTTAHKIRMETRKRKAGRPKEVYTYNTKLKKRLLKYATKFPELFKQTDDNKQSRLRFEIDKSRISIRLTAPYSDDRRKAANLIGKKVRDSSEYVPKQPADEASV